jgi:quinol monooxygenase YgiN
MEAKITDSRKDDGCIDYAYSFDALDNGLVHVIEKWRDRDALEAHFRTVHFSEWRAQVSALAVTDREMVAYETDDGFYI